MGVHMRLTTKMVQLAVLRVFINALSAMVITLCKIATNREVNPERALKAVGLGRPPARSSLLKFSLERRGSLGI